jgi:hypothetical protein
MVNKSPFMERFTEFAPQKEEIRAWVTKSREQWTEMFSMDFSDYEWDLNLVEEQQKKTFAEGYEKTKKSELINNFIIVCDRLARYKKHINDAKNLSPTFITTMAGAEFNPFPFTSLNLKYIFSLPAVQENTKHFFLIVLNKAFELTYNLWNEITSPDINVDEFVDIIMANIKEIQKRPELSRCAKAFKKIEESVHLLKGRFNNYYRDFVQTKNSTIMMEHFIIDVSKNTKADAQTTAQFRKIISFYQKIAKDQITNPKIKAMFDKVNDSFRELERNTEISVNIRENESDEETVESDDDVESEEEEDEEEIQRRENEMKARVAAQDKSVNELAAEIESVRVKKK